MVTVNPITVAIQYDIAQQLPESSRKASSRIGTLLWAFWEEFLHLGRTLASFDPWRYDPQKTSGLNMALRNGRVHDGAGNIIEHVGVSVTLAASQTNYVQMNPLTGLLSNTTGFIAGNLALYVVTTGTASISAVIDKRTWNEVAYGKVIKAENLENQIADFFVVPDTTPTAEVANAKNCYIDLYDNQGNFLVGKRILEVWLSDTAYGWESATAPSTSVTIPDGTVIQNITNKVRYRLQTSAGGRTTLRITHTGAKTWYPIVLMDDGRVYSGSAITFV